MQTTTTDALCLECQHMRLDVLDQSRWCYSPQLMKLQARGTRCVFERDAYPEPERRVEHGTQKCGPDHKNFKRREMPNV